MRSLTQIVNNILGLLLAKSFDFEPYCLIIGENYPPSGRGYHPGTAIFVGSCPWGVYLAKRAWAPINLSWAQNNVSWSSQENGNDISTSGSANSSFQCNSSGMTYYYIAIGA